MTTAKVRMLEIDPDAVSYKLNDHREDRRHWYVDYTDETGRSCVSSGALTAREAWINALEEMSPRAQERRNKLAEEQEGYKSMPRA